MVTEGFIARRTVGDGGPAWIWSASAATCDGFGAPGEPPRFATHHRDVRVGVWFLRLPWRARRGRRFETTWTRACAACAFVAIGIGTAHDGGSAAPPRRYQNDSASPAPSRGLVGERLLWLAVLRDAVAIIAGRGVDVTLDDVDEVKAWVASPDADVGSLAFVSGVLGLDADATRAALRRLSGPSSDPNRCGRHERGFRRFLRAETEVRMS